MIIFFLTLFIISIVLLIPAVLLQSNGADNGVFSVSLTSGAFGAKSNEVLVKFTGIMATTFIVSALLLSVAFVKNSSPKTALPEAIAPEATTTPIESETLPLAE